MVSFKKDTNIQEDSSASEFVGNTPNTLRNEPSIRRVVHSPWLDNLINVILWVSIKQQIIPDEILLILIHGLISTDHV
jgi:hypothetical protein